MSEPSSTQPAAAQTDPQALAIEAAQLRAALDMQRQESERLLALADQRASELTAAQKDQDVVVDAWRLRLDQLKERAVRFRDAYDAQVSDLAEKDKQVAVLTSKLEAKESALERSTSEREGLTDALDRERASLGNVLEARLVALEEFTRMATDRIATQMELLGKIEERAVGHEALTQRLLGAVSTLNEPRALPGRASADLPALMDVLKRPRIALFAGGVVVLFLAVPLFVWLASAPAGEVPTPHAAAAPANNPATTDIAKPVPAEQRATPPSADAAAEPLAVAVAPAAEEVTDAAPPEPEIATASPAPRELTPAEETSRKQIRKKMFAAYSAKAWQKAISYGERLRDDLRLDWEAEFRLADSLRRAGRTDEAAVAYEAFIEHYPESGLLDEVLFRRASILAKTDQRDEAVKIFAYLSARKNPFRGAAKKSLKALRKKR